MISYRSSHWRCSVRKGIFKGIFSHIFEKHNISIKTPTILIKKVSISIEKPSILIKIHRFFS